MTENTIHSGGSFLPSAYHSDVSLLAMMNVLSPKQVSVIFSQDLAVVAAEATGTTLDDPSGATTPTTTIPTTPAQDDVTNLADDKGAQGDVGTSDTSSSSDTTDTGESVIEGEDVLAFDDTDTADTADTADDGDAADTEVIGEDITAEETGEDNASDDTSTGGTTVVGPPPLNPGVNIDFEAADESNVAPNHIELAVCGCASCCGQELVLDAVPQMLGGDGSGAAQTAPPLQADATPTGFVSSGLPDYIDTLLTRSTRSDVDSPIATWAGEVEQTGTDVIIAPYLYPYTYGETVAPAPGQAVEITYKYNHNHSGVTNNDHPPVSISAYSITPITDGSAIEGGYEAAMQLWSSVANITFTEVTSGDADMGLNYSGALPSGAAGLAITPTFNGGGWPAEAMANNGHIMFSDVYVGTNYSDFSNGSYGLTTVIHEMGHALGLKHPGNYNGSGSGDPPIYPVNLDSTDYSIMTYEALWNSSTNRYDLINGVNDYTTDEWNPGYTAVYSQKNPETPMLHDIAAIQYLYGANTSYNSGDTSIDFVGTQKFWAVWDGGGTDTLNASNVSGNHTLDLREGTSHANVVGEEVLWVAYNASVENATGGSGNDTINGNDLTNVIVGNAGNDSIYGNGGDDTITGGLGNDNIDGNAGDDQAIYADSFSNFNITVNSATQVTIQDTNAGSNGDEGTDIVSNIFEFIFDGITYLFDGSVIAPESGGSPTQGDDTIYGTAAGENIDGLGGNDSISSGGGNDTLGGGFGDDTIVGGAGDSNLWGYAGNDSLVGGSGAEWLWGGAGNDTMSSGGGADRFTGMEGNDRIIGNDSDDIAEYRGNYADYTITVNSGSQITIRDDAPGDRGDDGTDVVIGVTNLSFNGVNYFFSNGTVQQGSLNAGINGTAASENLSGDGGNDVMSSGGGDDTLSGFGGDDTITGGSGDSNLWGYDGNDSLIGGSGAEWLWGGAGDDTMSSGGGGDRFTGMEGNDRITGDGADDVAEYRGNFSDYTITVNSSAQLTIRDDAPASQGDDGTDTTINVFNFTFNGVDYYFDGSVITQGSVGIADNIVNGAGGSENLRGGSNNDSISSGGGDDTLAGFGGNDTLIGDSGNSNLWGYDGNDSLVGGSGDEWLWGGSGNDTMSSGGGSDRFTGAEGDDRITGNGSDDVAEYNGNFSDYSISVVNATQLTIEDTVGSDGTDTVIGVFNFTFNDVDYYFDGSTVALGSVGVADNVVSGGAGTETLRGTSGNDSITSGGGDDTLIGLNGNDTLIGGSGDSDLWGYDGDDSISGGNGSEWLWGGGGNDILNGGGGNDRIEGVTGVDQLTGGGGADTFIFNRSNESGINANRDVITDFSQGDGDRIQLNRMDGSSHDFQYIDTAGFSGSAGEVRYGVDGSDTIVQIDLDGNSSADVEIELTGVYNLNAGDFVL